MTLDSTITPIRVTHEFSLQIYFSIWGEDAAGKPLPKPGPGQLRKAILSQGVLITSVSRLPARLTPGHKADNYSPVCVYKEQSRFAHVRGLANTRNVRAQTRNRGGQVRMR